MRPGPALVLLVVLLAGACSKSARSVVLVTLGATRADALGAYGRSPSPTPQLDRLAEEGVVFERAFTVAPLTLPAHASMLTGLFPPRHGVRDDGLAPLPQSASTLAERARAAGRQTAAFLGSAALDLGLGLEQGFEVYEAPARRYYNTSSESRAERPAHEVVGRAVDWLRARDAERGFLLWVHLSDARAPHDPTPEQRARAGGDPYLGEVAAVDLALGRLFATLRSEGLEDSALIVVVGDHGTARGEHGEMGHGSFAWNTTLCVPFLVRLPGGARAGTRVSTVASTADVLPTALEALGLEPEEGGLLDGESLLRRAPPGERGAYFESYHGSFAYGWHPLTGWVDGAGKLVHGPVERYFAAADASEEHDLAAQEGGRVAALRAALATATERPALPRDAEGIDPDLRSALDSIGYAGASRADAGAPGPLEVLARPDPFERAAELARFLQAEAELAAGRATAAELALCELLDENPRHAAAWGALARALMLQNRHREALAALEHARPLAPPSADSWYRMGACQVVMGMEPEALGSFTRALELDPNHAHALQGLVSVLESAGLGARAAPFRARFDAVRSRP